MQPIPNKNTDDITGVINIEWIVDLYSVFKTAKLLLPVASQEAVEVLGVKKTYGLITLFISRCKVGLKKNAAAAPYFKVRPASHLNYFLCLTDSRN